MNDGIFRQKNFEIKKSIKESKGGDDLRTIYPPRNLIMLDKRERYHTLNGLNNLDGYILALKDLFDIRIEDCDLNKDDKIQIASGIIRTNIKNCTIPNELNISNIDLEYLIISDSYIDKLIFYNCKNLINIFLYNTTINKIAFNYCNIYQGILMNDGCAIYNLDANSSFIINYRKHYYNNIYSKYIRNSYDYIIDDRLIDIVKDRVSLNNSCIIEQEGDEAFNYYYNKKNNEDIEPINEN